MLAWSQIQGVLRHILHIGIGHDAHHISGVHIDLARMVAGLVVDALDMHRQAIARARAGGEGRRIVGVRSVVIRIRIHNRRWRSRIIAGGSRLIIAAAAGAEREQEGG